MVRSSLTRLTLSQRFMLASMVILLGGMAGLGWWVGDQISEGVVHRAASTTALYVDSFIAPHLQPLATQPVLPVEHESMLDKLLTDTTLGKQIVSFKVWGRQGNVIHTSNPALRGQVFAVEGAQARAWLGQIAARISDLEEAENVSERSRAGSLLEIYSPVRLEGTNQIIAVAEFYQSVEDLRTELGAAQVRSWLVVGVGTLVTYLLLAGFVQRASNTIVRQQKALTTQVRQLTELLNQNAELHERVRRAAAEHASLTERFLRRYGAELHDGPAQDLALALLQLDKSLEREEAGVASDGHQLQSVKSSVSHALHELRAISAGMSLPQLQSLSTVETIQRAVRTHERATGTSVRLQLGALPEHTSLPLKIAAYRVIQEALRNAFRHAGGAGQSVSAQADASRLIVEVVDQGPGFDRVPEANGRQHLGIPGMRERVESLGGRFSVDSGRGRGTRVRAELPLAAPERPEDHGG